jgi:hypothetical protein
MQRETQQETTSEEIAATVAALAGIEKGLRSKMQNRIGPIPKPSRRETERRFFKLSTEDADITDLSGCQIEMWENIQAAKQK